MKQSLLLIILGISLYSCSNSDEARKKENLGIIKQYLQAVETKNTDQMASLLADNYKGYGPSVQDSTTKEQAIANWKNNAENLYESIKYSRFQNIAIHVDEGEEAMPGDWVSSWAITDIKYKDGRGPVKVWVNVVYKIENGKIAMSRTFYNEADVLRQLGYECYPPGQ